MAVLVNRHKGTNQKKLEHKGRAGSAPHLPSPPMGWLSGGNGQGRRWHYSPGGPHCVTPQTQPNGHNSTALPPLAVARMWRLLAPLTHRDREPSMTASTLQPILDDDDDADLDRAPLPAPAAEELRLDDPALFLNRELTWLAFNARVLHEAEDLRIPLLERVKFLAIVSNNLDEFFMKRIGGLKQQIGASVHTPSVDGRTPPNDSRFAWRACGRCMSSRSASLIS